MKLSCENGAYDKLYLQDNLKVHEFVFRIMSRNEKYCVFSMIDKYMRESDVRRKMDMGNWSALNKAHKQLLESVDFTDCEPRQYDIDEISIAWIADMYVLLQWKYKIPSAEISRKIPSKKMFSLFNPLYETSYENACDKLYKKFWGQKKNMNDTINEFKDEYFFLSNFYEAKVEFEGIVYLNNEAAFQAQKCLNKEDRKQFASLNPSEAKKLGRSVVLRKDWEDIKIDVMKKIVRAKFEQNLDLREKLLETGDAHLEEGNTWGDRIWGTVNGFGANNLGRILMEIRSEFSHSVV